MIDMHRGKAAFVVMRVPESKLLAAMGGTERVVNVENLQPARLHGGAELVNKSPMSRAASVLRGAFSRREIVDCEARLKEPNCYCVHAS
jgi:1,4-dihydroxy-2-naphthoyl-CoA synthase